MLKEITQPSTDPPRKCLPVAAIKGRYRNRPPRRRISCFPKFVDSHITQARREACGNSEPAGFAFLGSYDVSDTERECPRLGTVILV